jgi:acyl-CoA synthetase (AMP-forming)/AMP-acid ligase II/tetratricopeptide (TPR) repeat protein/thioesterase domain-containing protein/acyl carrier protein
MNSKPEYSNLVELLQWRASFQPQQCAYIFEIEGKSRGTQITYEQLDRQARAIAAQLKQRKLVGERALLLYPPGLEFIAAFFGCLYAGTIAVPCYPPRANRSLLRLQTIRANSKAKIALTTSDLLSRIEGRCAQTPDLSNLQWLATDFFDLTLSETWQPQHFDLNTPAFLQYTSGSTGTPKGVIVSHGNLIHNSACIQNALEFTPDSLSVTWLPSFHDMGLICGILQPLYTGYPGVLLSPITFIGQPLRWLEAISRYQATHGGSPNFGYELCIRKTTPEQRQNLDLSHWRVAYNGAEPICSDTLKRFTEAFSPCGFSHRSFYPCYGLAESTLMVSGGVVNAEPVEYSVKTAALEKHRSISATPSTKNVTHLVGCGQAILDTQIVIVDKKKQTRCDSDRIGEIWVSSPSVALGYWRRPHVTQQTFQAYLADTGEGPFLRTGDLGFLRDGELFVTGRSKDLLILGGRNYYPQDLERAAQGSHPALRSNCGAAFTVTRDGEERLVMVHELERSFLRAANLEEIARSISASISEQYELIIDTIVFLKTGSIPKTSSGKIQRRQCRSQFLDETLDVVFSSTLANRDKNRDSKLTPQQIEAIETAFKQHPRIAEAAILLKTDELGTSQTIAYIVPKPAQAPTLEELQNFWCQNLPNIPLPQIFISLEKFPQTDDGEIDYLALPNPPKSSYPENFVAPHTETEKRLAVLWQQILWLDRAIGLNENFFDLGGNSLQAARLVEKIETEFDRQLPLEALSRLSTIKALAHVLDADGVSVDRSLEQGSQSLEIDTNYSEVECHQEGEWHSLLQVGVMPNSEPNLFQINPKYYRQLLTFTAGWQGQRIGDKALIVGKNPTGTLLPLFWCLQNYRELTQLSKYLGVEQPIYGMRSAHLVMDYTEENISALAADYVQEILTIQPEGAYLLGGNCQGVAIAWEISRQLKNLGKTVQLLCLLDGFYQSAQAPHIVGMPHLNVLFDRELCVPRSYEGEIALFFGRESPLNPYKLFREPELGWRKLYRQGYSIDLIPGTHGEFFNEPNIQDFAQKLKTRLAASQFPTPEITLEFQQLSQEAYQAKISVKSPVRGTVGDQLSLAVTVKNISPVTWRSTDCSAILLGNHWLEETQTYIQWNDDRTPLLNDLLPGEAVELILIVNLPTTSGYYQLELDLVEEGITWFKDRGSQTTLVDVQVNPEIELPKLEFPYPQMLAYGPNIMGGTGGSGTRAIARIVRQGGMFIGSKLNVAEDAIALARPGVQKLIAFWQSPLPREIYTEVLAELQIALEQHLEDFDQSQARSWGWKLPPSIFFLPFFNDQFPQIKCLHLVRDGRDIAFSNNQNQLTYLAKFVLTEEEKTWSQPLQSIQLWSRLNLACADYGEQYLGDRYLRIRFEDLCEHPQETIKLIFKFFNLTGNIQEIAKAEVQAPTSIGRWRDQDEETIAEIHKIGQVALNRFSYLESSEFNSEEGSAPDSSKMFLREHFEFLKTTPISPKEHRKLGDQQFKKGDFEGAIIAYQKAISLGYIDPKVYHRLGKAFYYYKQFNRAIVHYQKALQLEDRNPVIYVDLGKAQHESGDIQSAIANYKTAISLKFASIELYKKLGDAYSAVESLDEAISTYQKLLDFAPDLGETHFKLGNLNTKKGNIAEAISSYRQGIQLYPEQVDGYLKLGNAYLKENSIEKAIEAYQQAAELNPKNAISYRMLGNAKWIKKDLDGAISSYQKSLEINPEQPFGVYKNMGDALSQKGRDEEAIIAYTEALKLQPDTQAVYRSLERLQSKRKI